MFDTLLRICLLIAIFTPVCSIIGELPGFYTDRVTLWGSSPRTYGISPSGVNYHYTWRQALPSVQSVALTLRTFDSPKGYIPSFIVEVIHSSLQSVVINLKTDHITSGIASLTFSIAVVTEIKAVGIYPFLYSQPNCGVWCFQIAHFNQLDPGNPPSVVPMVQWISFNTLQNNTHTVLIFQLPRLNTFQLISPGTIKLYVFISLLKEIKFNVLIIQKQIDSNRIDKHQRFYGYYDFYYAPFKYNMEVDSDRFGQLLEGQRCLIGYSALRFYYHSAYWNQFFIHFQLNSNNHIEGLLYGNAITQGNTNIIVTCYACQECESKVGRESKVGLIVGLVIGSLVTIAIIVILIVCLYRRYKKKEEQSEFNQTRQVAYIEGSNPNIPIEPQLQRSSLPPIAGVWIVRSNAIDLRQVCSICLSTNTYFKTNCLHAFHINCIVEWSLRADTCPLCVQPLKDKLHKIYCRECKIKEKLITFKVLQELSKNKRIREEQICEDCSKLPV